MKCPFISLKRNLLLFRQEIDHFSEILVYTVHLICILDVFCRDRV